MGTCRASLGSRKEARRVAFELQQRQFTRVRGVTAEGEQRIVRALTVPETNE